MKPLRWLSQVALVGGIEKQLIDRMVLSGGSGLVRRVVWSVLRKLQNGRLQSYALLGLLTVLVLVTMDGGLRERRSSRTICSSRWSRFPLRAALALVLLGLLLGSVGLPALPERRSGSGSAWRHRRHLRWRGLRRAGRLRSRDPRTAARRLLRLERFLRREAPARCRRHRALLHALDGGDGPLAMLASRPRDSGLHARLGLVVPFWRRRCWGVGVGELARPSSSSGRWSRCRSVVDGVLGWARSGARGVAHLGDRVDRSRRDCSTRRSSCREHAGPSGRPVQRVSSRLGAARSNAAAEAARRRDRSDRRSGLLFVAMVLALSMTAADGAAAFWLPGAHATAPTGLSVLLATGFVQTAASVCCASRCRCFRMRRRLRGPRSP